VSLSTTVYSIAKDQDNPFLNRVEGVYGIAYNRDAIAGSWVTLKIVPQSSYGIVGNSVRDNNWNFIYPDQGGTISFTMPFNNVRGFADCFHLTGTAAISGQTFGYQLARIEAYEEQNDYIWKQIGSAVTIPANGQWTIPVPEGYVYDGTGKIYFKVFSQAQGQPNQDFVITEYVSNLIDNKTVTLNVPLFTVSNFRVQSTTPSSVTLAWDPASWATGGYRVYRQDYSWNDWELRTPVELTATSYTIDGSGIYSYAVVGLYGTPATEGQKAVLENVLPGFTAPSNVSATVDRNNPLQVNVSWASVPNADSYYVYRDGIYVYSGYYSTSWTDNTGYALLGSEHSYTIKARNSSYDKESDFSVPALVNLPIADIGVNNRYYGTISAPGEFNYYRVTVSNWGDYRVYLTDRDSGIDAYVDAYVHVYVNGSWNTFDSGSVSLYLSPGTEVIVAVRSLSGTSTGSYEVSIQQY
jgi:hypothetical protein